MSNIYSPGGHQIFDYLDVIRRDEPVFDDTFDSDDLSHYTEAKFFDFDMGQPGEDMDMSSGKKDIRGNEAAAITATDLGLKEMDFLNDFDTFDFQFIPTTGAETLQSIISLPGITTSPVVPHPHPHPNPNPNPSISSTTSSPAPFTPKPTRRKSSADPDSFEEASRLAADEDKRRRNTAASARFRVKKKQREQALERTAKEMTDKCTMLEQRISRLELENKWLKSLIVEKNSDPGEDDPSVLFAAKYSAAIGTGECKGGVGTA